MYVESLYGFYNIFVRVLYHGIYIPVYDLENRKEETEKEQRHEEECIDGTGRHPGLYRSIYRDDHLAAQPKYVRVCG